MKIKLLIGLIAGILLSYAGIAFSQGSSLWFVASNLLRPVLSTWDVYAPSNLRFDGEIRPDGSTCSNGQILKRTAANDWDCAADDSSGSAASTTLDVIEKLLIEQPDIDGLSLPGMPAGAIGMSGAKNSLWTIYALKDGEASVYMTI